MRPLCLALLLLAGCTVGYVDREVNVCASLGAGSCTYDAADGSSDVRGAHVSVEAATIVSSIIDGVLGILRAIYLPASPAPAQ